MKAYCGKVKNFTPFTSKTGAFLIVRGNEYMEHTLGEFVIFSYNHDIADVGEKYKPGTEVIVYAPREWKPKTSMGGVAYYIVSDIRIPSQSIMDFIQDSGRLGVCPKCSERADVVKKERVDDGLKVYSVCDSGHFFATYV